MDSRNTEDDIRLLEESLSRAEAWYTQAIEASTNIRMRQTALNLRNRIRGLKRYIHNAVRGRREELNRLSKRTAVSRSPKQALANAVSRLVQGHPESATRMRELSADFVRLMSEALSLLRERAPSAHAEAVFNGSRKKLNGLVETRPAPARGEHSNV